MIPAIIKILKINPEDWIEFSAGQNTETNLLRFKEKNAILSILKQLLSYLYLILQHLSFRKIYVQKIDIMFFCVTPNQFSILYPVAIQLPELRYSFELRK